MSGVLQIFVYHTCILFLSFSLSWIHHLHIITVGWYFERKIDPVITYELFYKAHRLPLATKFNVISM